MLGVLRWEPSSGQAARQLIVMCHGVGADASQMAVFVEAWAPHLPHAAFMAPDAPEPYAHALEGYQWFSLDDRRPAILDAGARRAEPMLNHTIDHERSRLGLPPERVALAGFSQGAMMVLHAGLRRRPPPGAILAYSGALLDSPGLGAECAGTPPVLLVHGESDEVVPLSRGIEARAVLARLGIAARTCWCPGLGHSVDDAGLKAGAAFLRSTVAAGGDDEDQ